MQNSQELPVTEFFLKKNVSFDRRCFPVNSVKLFRISFFTEQLQATASVHSSTGNENWGVLRDLSRAQSNIYDEAFLGIIHLVLTRNFPKNYHFSPPDAHTNVSISGGKKC